MSFNNNEKISASDKLKLQIIGTADDAPGTKWWYNESLPWIPEVTPTKILSQISSVPGAANTTQADAAVIANPTLLEKRTARLTVDPTSNNRTFEARITYGDRTTNMYENWIEPAMVRNSGDASWGYAIQLWNGDPAGAGVQLPTTYLSGAGGAPSWEWNYSTGALKVSTDQSANYMTLYSTNGLFIVGYRYIGPTGGGSAGGGMTLDVTQANTFVQGDAIYLSSTGWVTALADNENTLGVAIASACTPTSFTAIFGGPITGLTGKVAGQYYFVSATSTGKLTNTEPNAYSNPLLLATSSTGGVVLPFRPSTAGILTVVLPELTTIQRIALTPFAVSGSLVIDTDLEKVFRKRGSIWVEV